MAISLFEHNETAYYAALSMMKNTGKAAIVHPTGTGKSFIGFKLCEDNPNKKICWLSPSEYIFKTQLEKSCCRVRRLSAEKYRLLHVRATNEFNGWRNR